MNSLFLSKHTAIILAVLLGSCLGCNKTMVNFARDSDGQSVYINHKGKLILPPSQVWSPHTNFSQNLAGVRSNRDWKHGYINRKGVMVIEPKFTNVQMFYNGLAAVTVDEKWGYINKKGKFVIPPTYDMAFSFKTDYASVRLGRKWALINRKGEMIIDTISYSAFYFSSEKSLSVFTASNGLEGLINKKGEVIVEPIYKGLRSGSNGLFRAFNGKQNGFINASGDTVLPFIYEDAGTFSDGLAAVLLIGDTNYIYIDKLGNQKIPMSFGSAQDFRDGMAVVSVKNKYGVITKKGKYLLQPKYWYLSYHGRGCFSEYETERIFNKKGKLIWGDFKTE